MVRWLLIGSLLLSVVMFANVFLRTTDTQRPEASQEVSSISVDNLNFGEVWAQDSFKWVVHLTNRTSSGLDVSGFRTSCGCAKVEPPSLTIPPHNTADVTFTLNLGTEPITAPLHSRRSASLQVVPLIGGTASYDDAWVFEGCVTTPLSLSAATVFFDDDDYDVTKHKYRAKTIAFQCIEQRSLRAFAEPPCVSVRTKFTSRKSGVLEIVPKEDVTRDRFACKVRMVLEPEGGKSFIAASLPVAGKAAGDVRIIPDTVFFTPSRLGTSKEATVLLKSRSGTLFVVQSVKCSGKDVSVEPVSCATPGVHVYRIRQRMSERGQHTTNVDFETLSKMGGVCQIRLAVTWAGLP